MCVCVCLCIHTYILMYIHTHMCVHIYMNPLFINNCFIWFSKLLKLGWFFRIWLAWISICKICCVFWGRTWFFLNPLGTCYICNKCRHYFSAWKIHICEIWVCLCCCLPTAFIYLFTFGLYLLCFIFNHGRCASHVFAFYLLIYILLKNIL